MFEQLSRAALLRGSRVDAVKFAERCARCADEQSMLRLPRMFAERAEAEIALADGDPAKAAEHARNAVAGAAEAGVPIDEAISRMLAGRALAAAGERDEAVAELTAAGTIFEMRSATAYSRSVERAKTPPTSWPARAAASTRGSA